VKGGKTWEWLLEKQKRLRWVQHEWGMGEVGVVRADMMIAETRYGVVVG
jgi:hypothetical protein